MLDRHSAVSVGALKNKSSLTDMVCLSPVSEPSSSLSSVCLWIAKSSKHCGIGETIIVLRSVAVRFIGVIQEQWIDHIVPNVDVVEKQILGMESRRIEETVGLLPGDRCVRQVAVAVSRRSRCFF